MTKTRPIIFAALISASVACILFFGGLNIGQADTICNVYGSTANCTDSTGQGTTYNQYGNTIYGSDGSTATIYQDPVYNMGSGPASFSTAGADMDNPETKATYAKYESACLNKPFNGGAEQKECQDAVLNWMNSLDYSQKNNSSSYSESEDDYSDNSDSSSKDTDELLNKLLSTLNTQTGNTCVSQGYANTHPENGHCVCDNGYLHIGNGKCVPLSVQSCVSIYGENAIPVEGSNTCTCPSGYSINPSFTFNSNQNVCILSTSSNTSRGNQPVSSELAPVNTFEVSIDNILPLNIRGDINSDARLRSCPSTQCPVIGTYPKGIVVEITGKYKKDTWFRVSAASLGTGWIHQSLINIIDDEVKSTNSPLISNASSAAPIKMTRAEYEAKYGTPTSNTDNTDVKEEKVSWWRKVFSWFGF